jgi:phosphohistidine phosphatase
VKTLLIVRHAKSSWGDPGLDDHERPLNARGLRDAPEMGRRLRERGIMPDVIRSSTAVRARSTAALIAEQLQLPPEVVVLDERLYGSSPETIMSIVAELDPGVAVAMVVAHDPGLSELAFELSGTIEHMPTCAIAEFTFEVADWPAVVGAEPAAVRFDAPR